MRIYELKNALFLYNISNFSFYVKNLRQNNLKIYHHHQKTSTTALKNVMKTWSIFGILQNIMETSEEEWINSENH